MDDAVAKAKKSELDKELMAVGPNVGVAFGAELFNEFVNQGWITLETFGALGSTVWSMKLPAYAKTHYAIWHWGVPGYGFVVGKDA
jgi:hypothetical protein